MAREASRADDRDVPLPSSRGLSTVEAAARLRRDGRNEIDRDTGTHWSVTLLGQFNSPVIWLLGGACLLSAALGESTDAVAIAAIVVLNGVVGFVQEFRAEREILALRSMTAPRARVRRDGVALDVPAADVVIGDLLLLEAGDIVPADARLLQAHALAANEAPLTGESTPVEKSATPAPSDAALPDRHDSVFMGTAITVGAGEAEVVATGMRTELGRIAHLLMTVERAATPLQERLAALSRLLLVVCVAIVGAVALAGWWHGWAPMDVLLSAVSLAVAAVPEGLAAIVTIALAVGVRRMAARHVLIRRLPAVETLGCATVICTDKTGTLTTGSMRVREWWTSDPQRLFLAAAACCDAEVSSDGRTGVGDPTEIAILLAAQERGILRPALEAANPRVEVFPFDSERRRMSIVRADGRLYVKGAVEAVLPLCRGLNADAADANAALAAKGLRVLAVAVGAGRREQDLELVGLIALADPPRVEAIDAVAAARRAGVRTVMITGDHPRTAHAIAQELGILVAGDEAAEVVHARSTPEHKLEIVRRWKARGAVVAMTGDGVNDAPALREAHIGVAMGKTGTEVTREASDMVLTDDNFASIVAAIQEGRAIFDNIRKTLVYLLSGNAGELMVMLAAAVVGLPLPLLPLHLLWINITTDGLPALALVMDPPEEDVLARPPRAPSEPMLRRQEWMVILFTGLLQAAMTLGVFAWALVRRDVHEARTLAFLVLVLSELFRAFAARSTDKTLWQAGARTNLRLLVVVAVSALVQLAIHLTPAARSVFSLTPLPYADLAFALAAGLGPVTVIELLKIVRRRTAPGRHK